MYVSYWLGFLVNVDPLLSVIAAGVFIFILGVLTYKLIIRYTIGKPGLVALLATFGLAMFLKNFCMNRFSPNFRILSDTWLGDKTLHLGGLIFPVPQLAAAILALVVVGLDLCTYKHHPIWLGRSGHSHGPGCGRTHGHQH